MHVLVRSLLLPAAAAGLLAACGGGVSVGVGFFDDDFDDGFPEFDLRPSGRSGSVSVSAGTDARLNGTYAHPDVLLSQVHIVSPTPRTPTTTCRFRFDGLLQAPGGRVLGGEIRYAAGNGSLGIAFIAIDSFEFRHDGGANSIVDRTAGVVIFDAAVFASTRFAGEQLTLTGNVPFRAEGRPEGC